MKKTIKPPRGGLAGQMMSDLVTSRLKKRKSSGLIGGAAGFVAMRIARRSPLGAVVVGGVYVVRSLYRKNQERAEDARARAAKPAKVVKPD